MTKKMTPSGRQSLIKVRYEENPFADDAGFRVPVRKKNVTLTTASSAAVMDVGGQQIAVAEIKQVSAVDAEPFVKLFVQELDRFYDLSPTSLRLITVFIRDIGKIRVGDGDQVYISKKSIDETLQAHGIKAPSSATYYRSIEELIEKGFIAPSTKNGLFFINPAIFFNGDRIRFVKEIRRKKTTKAEQLEADGQARLNLDAPEV